jgi:hypothetical protein
MLVAGKITTFIRPGEVNCILFRTSNHMVLYFNFNKSGRYPKHRPQYKGINI